MAKHEMPAAQKAPKASGPQNKKAQRAIAIVLVCLLLLGGGGTGIYYYLHNRTGKAVNVFPAEQLGMTDSWYDQVNTGGQVTADKMQTVYLSSTQTVTEIFVEEGQQVNVGDKLLAFDTTLDEVELTRKQIAIKQLELDLKKARERLDEINHYKVGSPGGYSPPEETPEPTAEPAPTGVPYFQHGEGTAEDPYVFLWDEGASLMDGTVDWLLDVAHGYDVPEVTTGPDVPLDPDQPPAEEQAPEQQPAEGGDAGQVPAEAGEPAPIAAGQGYTAPGLLRLVLPRTGGRVLRDGAEATEQPIETDQPTETTQPTEAVQPTENTQPTETVQPTENTQPTETVQPTESTQPTEAAPPTEAPPAPRNDPTPAPTLPSSFEEALLAWFRQKAETDPIGLWNYYEALSQAQKQVLADMLSDGQLAELTALLESVGVVGPTFPPRTGQATPTPAPTLTPDPSASPEPTPLPVGATYYMVFEIRANNSMQGDILWAFEVQFTLKELEWQRVWSWRVLEASYEPQVEQPEEEESGFGGGYFFDSSQYYPAAEIERMRAEAEREIASKNIELRMAEQELKQVEYELSNGEVLCDTAGVVKSVLDPDEALETQEPVVKISGGGGYFITGYMSEFDMQHMHVGDTVTVENYMAGETLDATITEISPYPNTSERYVDYYTSTANSNASKYPFTVEVDEDANLREGYYVNIYFSASGTPQAEQSGDTFYLENMFLRSEGGRSYVYAVGEDGLLEKRYVTTGRSVGGYYTEISSGVDPETDWLAFPYGRSVKDGAPTTQQEDIMVLYNGY